MKSRLFYYKLFLWSFIILLTLPLAEMFFRLDTTPPRNENRPLASLPQFPKSPEDFSKFLKGLESYFSDQFGFRNLFVELNAKVKYFGFGVSPTKQVVLGREGWHFSNLQNNIDLYRNRKPLTQKELSDYLDIIEARQKWSQKNGAQFVFVIAPDSHTINPEFLPAWVTKINPGSRFDQIKNGAIKRGINFLDLRTALIAAKKDYQVSYQTDTHWNSIGGYIAYREIISFFKDREVNLTDPIPISNYKIISESRPGLDLALTLGLQDSISESSPEMISTSGQKFERFDVDGLSFSTKYNVRDAVAMACICDSMIGNVMPHLSQHISPVRYYWGYIFHGEKIRTFKPNLVVNMVIERTLTLDWAYPQNVEID